MYSFQSKVRYSETNREGCLTLEAMVDYFQDVSTFHSEALGLGIDYLNQNKLVWVLSAWQIVVDRMPRLFEDIETGTFPYDFKGCFGYRNFWMKDKDGQYLARANSLWTLLDTKHMRPHKPTEEMRRGYSLGQKLDMEYAPRKIEILSEGRRLEDIVVKRHHIDSNNHVNNGQYVRIAMEYLPGAFEIKQMRAEYKKQAVLDDVMTVMVYEGSTSRIITLCDESREPYAVMEFAGNCSGKEGKK